MDTKNLILSMINNHESISQKYNKFEKIIFTMLSRHLEKQGKTLDRHINYTYEVFNSRRIFKFDAILPKGIDEINSMVAVELKIGVINPFLFERFLKLIIDINKNEIRIKSILFVITSKIDEELYEKVHNDFKDYGIDIYIWDINKIVEICDSDYEFFLETYQNINDLILDDIVADAVNDDKNKSNDKRTEHLEKLHKEYLNDNMVLFLGAGVSIDAKLLDWKALITELYVVLMDKKLKEHKINVNTEDKDILIQELIKQNGDSQLIQSSFLSSVFKDDFEPLVRDILYKNAKKTSVLLKAIGKLCISNRGKVGIQAIVNYNFDDLIEQNLKRLDVEYESIYSEGMTPTQGKLGVYHVHGFIPQKNVGYENLTKSLLVLSEDGYHKLMLEPYNWANISQLNFLINNTCIFIGHSMTDPNLRRLLEVVHNKGLTETGDCRHYAIFKRFKTNNKFKKSQKNALIKFEGLNESLQESFFEKLGINILWVDEFDEIPALISKIKTGD